MNLSKQATTDVVSNKMLELNNDLLLIENERLSGKSGVTLDELDSFLENIINLVSE